jgi:hypothetical protein
MRLLVSLAPRRLRLRAGAHPAGRPDASAGGQRSIEILALIAFLRDVDAGR